MSQRKFKDIGAAVFYSAGAVTLATLLMTSGLNKEFINKAITTAEGGTADADAYLTVIQVVVSAAPFVVAMLVTAAVLGLDMQLSSNEKIGTIVVTWFVAGVIANGFDPRSITDALNGASGPPPVKFFAAGVELLTSSYTPLLLVQAFVVSMATIISVVVLADKWSKPEVGGQ
jgi:hypothetical protein